jgi:hypothetical protein
LWYVGDDDRNNNKNAVFIVWNKELWHDTFSQKEDWSDHATQPTVGENAHYQH